LIICGGSGVSFGLGVLEFICQKMARRQELGINPNDDKFKTVRVRFVWILREYAHLSWISTALRRCIDMLSPDQLRVDLYVTADQRRLVNGGGHAVDDSRMVSIDEFAPPTPAFARAAARERGNRSPVGGGSLEGYLSEDELGGGSDSDAEGTRQREHQHPRAPVRSVKQGGGQGYGQVGTSGTGQERSAVEAYESALDLVLFEGEDDGVTAAEAKVSLRVKKEGKIRRALSRKEKRKSTLRTEVIAGEGVFSKEPQSLYQGGRPLSSLDTPSQSIFGSPETNESQIGLHSMAEDSTLDLSNPDHLHRAQQPQKRGSQGQSAFTEILPEPAVASLPPGAAPARMNADSRAPSYRTLPLQSSTPVTAARTPVDSNSLYDYRHPEERNIQWDDEHSRKGLLRGSETPSSRNRSRLDFNIMGNDSNGIDVAFDLDEYARDDLNVVAELATPGKPDLERTLDEEIAKGRGAVLVACCGPTSLNTIVRDLVADRISPLKLMKGDSRGSVSLVCEDFSF